MFVRSNEPSAGRGHAADANRADHSRVGTRFLQTPVGRGRFDAFLQSGHQLDEQDLIDRHGGSQNVRKRIRKSETVQRLNSHEDEALHQLSRNDARSESTRREGNRSSSVDKSQFARFMRLHQSNSFRLKTRLDGTPTATSITKKDAPQPYLAKHPLTSDGERQALTNKLAYEWKNIYKNLIHVNEEMGGQGRVGSGEYITIRDFNNVCQKFKVSFSREELKKM